MNVNLENYTITTKGQEFSLYELYLISREYHNLSIYEYLKDNCIDEIISYGGTVDDDFIYKVASYIRSTVDAICDCENVAMEKLDFIVERAKMDRR